MHPALFAGMASPLPLEAPYVQKLASSSDARLQAISFFLLAILICTTVVWALWNYLRRDWTKLPRLSFGKALAGVLLWGMLVFIVLTMISGARELMTPGAWKKSGFTYQLTPDPSGKDDNPSEERRRQLAELRLALWKFAATHEGRFPSETELGEIPDSLWRVPGYEGLRFRYVPGRKAATAGELLVVEPELDPQRRLVILTDGEIATLTTAEIQAWKPHKGAP
jgi:hypothetical protein